MRPDLPAGTVTFLFTDIEDSTRLLHELGTDGYVAALAAHRRALREAFMAHGGIEVDTQGDSFFVAFAEAAAAIGAAAEAQARLGAGPISVRMGLHAGTPQLTTEGYVGPDVHLGARIAAAGHGGQVLLSLSTVELSGTATDRLLDLGEHRVKGFDEPIWIFQLGDAPHPPLRTISNTNLPRLPSSFLGRGREQDEVSRLLRERARLVTLTGPGGTGKTRLAIETASSLVQEFRNGIFWVALVALRDPALLNQTIADALGAKYGLADHIGEREMLLVLDNFEQVVAAAPELGNLLAACSRLRMIVTSRERLNIQGEIEYAVPPLTDADAEALFVERSGGPSDDATAELCRRLDNLPLAIELAAARRRVLTPAQILERLGQRLDLLRAGRDADARQQTLRATISWSHDLLTTDERRLFARLAAFRAGCTLEAAEEVADADIDLLQSLVDKSLVRNVGDRFRMLETIREFAAERLEESGEAEAIRRRHATFYTALVDESERWISGPEQAAWWKRLDDEAENVRAALEWSCAGADPPLALRLTGQMWRFWWQRGHYDEGERWCEAALGVGRDEADELRALASYGLANMALGKGDTSVAVPLLEQCLAAFRRQHDEAREMNTLTDLGIAQTIAGRLDLARQLYRQVFEMAERLGDQRRLGVSLINLSNLALLEGDLEQGASTAEQAVAILRAVGDEQSEGSAMGTQADAEFRLGDMASAAKHLGEAIDIARRSDDRYAIAHHFVVATAILAAREDIRGAVVSAAGERLVRETHIWLDEVEESQQQDSLGRLRGRFGDSPVDAALAEGRTLEHEAAVRLALEALAEAAGG